MKSIVSTLTAQVKFQEPGPVANTSEFKHFFWNFFDPAPHALLLRRLSSTTSWSVDLIMLQLLTFSDPLWTAVQPETQIKKLKNN